MNSIKSICFFSSFLFVLNFIIMIYFQYFIYALLFFNLSLTSLYIHYNIYDFNSIVYCLDKVFILFIILYGGYLLFTKCNKLIKSNRFLLYSNVCIISIILLTFIIAFFLYGYGYYTNQFCFCPIFGHFYHFLLHIISNFGHFLIVLL